MNNPFAKSRAIALSLGVALMATAPLNASSKDAPAKAGTRTSGIPTVPEIALPQSVFAIPATPAEGRNPFFPTSTVAAAAPKVTRETPVESFTFVLNGITSPPRRTAMINGRTFDLGEEGEVRMPSGGRMLIKCEDIKADSAIINVGGQRRELKMRSGL
jgi:hypothetical protein